MTGKQPLSEDELKEHLEEQMSFLIDSSLSFDKGNTKEAKRLATTLRVLLHDHRQSQSVLSQLSLKTRFLDSRDNAPQIETPILSSWSQISLVGRLSGNPTHFYSPHFGRLKEERMVDFEPWWNVPVIVDKENNTFSRSSIVMSMADQDGGAHVDPKLKEDYYKLTRKNSVADFAKIVENVSGLSPSEKMKRVFLAEAKQPPVSPAFYTVRQIAHEVIVSILPKITSKTPFKYDLDIAYPGHSTNYVTAYGEANGGKTTILTSGKISLGSNND